MDGVMLLTEAAAAGLVVTADRDSLHIRGPRSAGALARRLIEYKIDVLAALQLEPADTVDVDINSSSPEQLKGIVNVNTVNTPSAILAQLAGHGLDLVAEPNGRVDLIGPPEAVAALPEEMVAAMEANWPALRPLATPEPAADLDEMELPNPCPKCVLLEVWWPIMGNARCMVCDPPVRGLKLLELAARLRRQRPRPSHRMGA